MNECAAAETILGAVKHNRWMALFTGKLPAVGQTE